MQSATEKPHQDWWLMKQHTSCSADDHVQIAQASFLLFPQSTAQKTDQDRWLVKHAYFQPREGARVSLYSDSHHDPGAPFHVLKQNSLYSDAHHDPGASHACSLVYLCSKRRLL